MKIGVYVKRHRTDFAPRLREVCDWLRSRGCTVLIEEEIASRFQISQGVPLPRQEIPGAADAIVVFGGDGTILSVARLVEGRNAPILAVNLGSLGFLTEVTLDELYPALEHLLSGRHRTERRGMLKARVFSEGRMTATYHALNDVVINKGALARMISLDGYVDGALIANFLSDGMILATPTGSTAYSLSAGGPIVLPVMDAFVITPICPHTLTNRPLVIPADSEIRFVLCSGDDVTLTIDGQVGVGLQEGDALVCTRSEYHIDLIQPHNKSFFDVLREKLKWGER